MSLTVRMRSSSGGSLSTGVVWDRHTGYFRFMLRKDTANVANIPKTTLLLFNWPINTNHDLQMLHLCTDQELK